MRSGRIIACAALLLALLPFTAGASPITGELAIYSAVDPVGGGSTLGTATGLDFVGPGVVLGFPAPDGAFAGTAGSAVTFQDFYFSPTLSPAPVIPLWQFSSGGVTFAFTLTSVRVVTQTAGFLLLDGSGVLTSSRAGLDPTLASWTFAAGSLRDGTFTVAPSASKTETVPEGGSTLVMLGLGVLAVAALRLKAPGLAA
jgi:hypothetical protein